MKRAWDKERGVKRATKSVKFYEVMQRGVKSTDAGSLVQDLETRGHSV